MGIGRFNMYFQLYNCLKNTSFVAPGDGDMLDSGDKMYFISRRIVCKILALVHKIAFSF
jgi:hypothetical protein